VKPGVIRPRKAPALRDVPAATRIHVLTHQHPRSSRPTARGVRFATALGRDLLYRFLAHRKRAGLDRLESRDRQRDGRVSRAPGLSGATRASAAHNAPGERVEIDAARQSPLLAALVDWSRATHCPIPPTELEHHHHPISIALV
jgi:hypothetical protein